MFTFLDSLIFFLNPKKLSLTILLLVATSTILSCSKPIEVEVVKAKNSSIESFVTTVNAGTVHALQSAELAFGAVGRVSKIYISLGDSVKEGDILAELENSDLVTAVWKASEDVKRLKTVDLRAVAKADKDLSIQSLKAAEMALEKTKIRAPYDGLISELNLEVGQLSQITTVIPKPLIKIVDKQPRYVRAEIDEIDIPRVRVGQIARVRILAYKNIWLIGSVTRVIPYVNSIREQDRTAQILIDFEGSDASIAPELPVGASADIEVSTRKKDLALIVPSKAILGTSNERYLFVVKDSALEKVVVDTDISNYDFTEITSKNVKEGDLIALPPQDVELSEGLPVVVKLKNG
jgi:HlyD family secretion protein